MPTKWYTWVALVCATWFALTSWAWFYLVNIVFSYPFGVIALAIWWFTRKQNPESKINKVVFWLLIGGWLSSIVAILLYR